MTSTIYFIIIFMGVGAVKKVSTIPFWERNGLFPRKNSLYEISELPMRLAEKWLRKAKNRV